MENTYIVYKHTNAFNKKSYIGITVHGENPNLRWQNGRGYSENEKFFKDIIEFGWSNFTHEILQSNLTEQEALILEKEYIIFYDSVNNGYNNSYGNNVHGPESRKKISQALIGLKRSQTSIQKQLSTKLKNSGNLAGVDFETSKSSKRVRCKETLDVFCSISEACNWCHSTKVGACCNGKRKHAGKHPITNQPLSWEYVDKDTPITIRCEQKLITKKIQRIICLETGIIYNNASEASRATGISVSNILRVCQHERKSAGKMHWQFYEGDEL